MFASVISYRGGCISLFFFANVLYAQPVYQFNTNADVVLKSAFPTPSLHVNITLAYLERTNHFTPASFDVILNKNNTWADVMAKNGSFQVPSDATESYWLSLLGGFKDFSGGRKTILRKTIENGVFYCFIICNSI